MPRKPAAPSRMEILLLTSLSRAPMHGYELKLELEYKHVEWWAKCEHGHLYAALARLERGKFIKPVAGSDPRRRVFAITPSGRKRVMSALEALGTQPDATYFDIDMFLSGCHLLERKHVLEILERRREGLAARHTEATELAKAMRPHVPAVGVLIIEHRIEFLRREAAFVDKAIEALREETHWGPFLGDARIEEFVERTHVPLERR